MSAESQELKWANVDIENKEERELFRLQLEKQAGERARAEVKRLQELGIIDEQGRLLRTDLPPDMGEDSECDL